MNEQRLIDIETKLAHQEYLVGALNDVVTEQQGRISALEDLCRSLAGRLRELAAGSADAAPAVERPPHY